MKRVVNVIIWILLFFGAFSCSGKERQVHEDFKCPSFQFSVPSSGIKVFDCNGDGKKDVVVLNGADRPFWRSFSLKNKGSKPGGLIFLNSGTGELSGESPLRIPDIKGCVSCAENLDLDGDGDQDLVMGSGEPDSVGGYISILLNDGRGRFSMHSVLPVERAPRALCGADLDGDGDMDVAVGSFIPDSGMCGKGLQPFYLLKQEKNGRFSVTKKNENGPDEGVPWEVGAITAQDLDGDGLPEIVIGGAGFLCKPRPISLYVNKGGLHFLKGPELLKQVNCQVMNFAWLDMNGDGLKDLVFGGIHRVLGSLEGGVDGVGFLARKSPNSMTFQWRPLKPDLKGGPVLAEDLDGDGDPDLSAEVRGEGGKHKIALIQNEGKGAFRVKEVLDTGNDRFFPMALTDMNGDSLPDIVFIEWAKNPKGRNRVVLLLNQGKWGFLEACVSR